MQHDTHTQRVILVDDSDSDNDNFFHDIAVRKCGFIGEIRVFDKGEDALAFLLSDRVSVPTMVFMDINMAGMGASSWPARCRSSWSPVCRCDCTCSPPRRGRWTRPKPTRSV